MNNTKLASEILRKFVTVNCGLQTSHIFAKCVFMLLVHKELITNRYAYVTAK